MQGFRLRFLGREVHLPDAGSVAVGRDATCEISLDDPLVSRRHATFTTSEEGLEVIDHGGVNGTAVNGVPVVGSIALAHRDRVRMGSHVFVILESGQRKATDSDTQLRTPTRAITRRIQAAVRPGGALDAIERALQNGQVAKAAESMIAIVGADGDSVEVPDEDLARLSQLLLTLAERGRDVRFLDRMLGLHVARREVVSTPLIDALREAAPHLPRESRASIDDYVSAMRPIVSDGPVQTRVRLRLISAIGRDAARREGA